MLSRRSHEPTKLPLRAALLVLVAALVVGCPSTPSVNHAPVAEDATVSTPVGTPVQVTLDAHDPDGDALVFTVHTDPTHGDVAGVGGTRTYTPDEGFSGTDAFTFTASDGTHTSNLATITLHVVTGNRPPIAHPQGVATDQDTPVQVTLAGGDPDGDPLTFDVDVPPEHGTVQGTAPTLTYTPDPGYTGWDEFGFTVSDGEFTSGRAYVAIDVGNTNDPPTDLLLDPYPLSVPENQLAGADIGTFEAVDADTPYGDAHTYTLVPGTDDDNGDFTITGDTLSTATVFDYETDPTKTIRVRATDLMGAYLETTFVITVDDENDPPDLAPIAHQTMLIGEWLDLALVVQDETPDGLTFDAVSDDPFVIADGDLHLSGVGATRILDVTPTPCHAGTATITVTVTDPEGLYDTEAFDVTIEKPFQDPPSSLAANDPAADDSFGYDVAIDGDYAIVGVGKDDHAGTNAGAAYVFERRGTSWMQVATLLADDASALDYFGLSVDIDGPNAIVGSIHADSSGPRSGSAYLFHRDGSSWTQTAKLKAGHPAAHDAFGSSVAIDGDVAIVGAYGVDVAGAFAGAAYVFQRDVSGWTSVELLANDARTNDFFGAAVDVSGDHVVVGAPDNDVAATDDGSAYVFQRNGSSWTHVAKLTANDGAQDDEFGMSVAIHGQDVIVGAFGASLGGHSEGAAYAFRGSGHDWVQVDKLTASDAAIGDHFGLHVAVGPSYALVSASGNPMLGASEGTVYVFQRCGDCWKETAKLASPNAPDLDDFGRAIDVSFGHVIVGAPSDDVVHTDDGSAHIFAAE
jgi:hypothetical protein